MDTTELLLLLSGVAGIGDSTISHVLRRNAVLRRGPDDFLALAPDRWVSDYAFRRDAAAALAEGLPERRAQAAEQARLLRRHGIVLLTLLDATYPARLLRRMDDPPPFLYAYGSLAVLDGPLFAVANSNEVPEAALTATDAAATLAVEGGWSPVTGHNRVPYQRPALVARRRGGRVCYALDRGIMEAFGSDLSRELFPAARIWSPAYDPERDLTLTPFSLYDHGLGDHNRRRDELVFALADAIFVGAIRPGGQMERGCLRALSQGRPVCLLGPVDPEREAGLLARGAVRLDPCDAAAIAAVLATAAPREAGDA